MVSSSWPSYRWWKYWVKMGLPSRLSTGMSKKPWIWEACRSMVSTRSAPAATIMLATSLAEMGSRGLAFRSCRA